MDNKQDRQLYWEVKDFLNKSFSVQPSPPQPTIADTVKSVLNENKPFRQSAFSNNTKLIDNAREFVKTYEDLNKKNKPNCVAYTSNKMANPFNKNSLYEYVESRETVERKRMEAAARNERARQRNAIENKRLEDAKAEVRRKRESTVFGMDLTQQQPNQIASGNQGANNSSSTVFGMDLTQQQPSQLAAANQGGNISSSIDDKITMNLPPPEMTIKPPQIRGSENRLGSISRPMPSSNTTSQPTLMASAQSKPRRESMADQFSRIMGMERQQNQSQTMSQMGNISSQPNLLNALSSNTVVPFNQLGNLSSQKDNQFKYSTGSRLS
jgi:hypothetical protein